MLSIYNQAKIVITNFINKLDYLFGTKSLNKVNLLVSDRTPNKAESLAIQQINTPKKTTLDDPMSISVEAKSTKDVIMNEYDASILNDSQLASLN